MAAPTPCVVIRASDQPEEEEMRPCFTSLGPSCSGGRSGLDERGLAATERGAHEQQPELPQSVRHVPFEPTRVRRGVKPVQAHVPPMRYGPSWMAIETKLGSTLPALAREALRRHLTGLPAPPLEEAKALPSGVFVSLHTRSGQLRGCVGTIVPREADVRAETIKSAVMAGCKDPRFLPITSEELGDLEIEVTVLEPLQEVESSSDLDPHRYGVVVRDASGRQGVLLPDLDGIDDVPTQLSIAKRKADISPEDPVTLFRFRAAKYREY